MTELKLSDQVERVCAAESIRHDELRMMVRAAAPYTDEEANRRFHHWLFEVANGEVVRMFKTDITNVGRLHGASSSIMINCQYCEGEGCTHCGWRGFVRRLS